MMSSIQKLCSHQGGPAARSFSSFFQGARTLNQPVGISSLQNTLLPARCVAGYQRSISSHFSASELSHQERHPSTPLTLGWGYRDPIPSGPITIGWVETDMDMEIEQEAPTPPPMRAMNRNARRGKRANRGKRPVSRARRRTKKRAFGNHRR
jgi:hypothetical protein